MSEYIGITDEILAHMLCTDTRVLGELIERYEKKISRYLHRKSNATESDIEDILQNIFIKVYKNIYDFDTALSFSSWIYRIARNEMIDWYRKEKRTPHLSLEANEYILDTIAHEFDTITFAEGEEKKEILKKSLMLLPEKYQEIIELRYFEEKSYEEIADILSIPSGTVAIRISRAKKALQSIVQPYGTQ